MYVVYERSINWMNSSVNEFGQKYYYYLANLLRDYPEARLDEKAVESQDGLFYKKIKVED